MIDLASENGASSVEYGLLLAAIAAVIIAVVFSLGTQVFGLYQALEGRF